MNVPVTEEEKEQNRRIAIQERYIQMNDRERKDFDEKVIALKILEVQYPAMKILRETLKNDPHEFRRLYAITLIDIVSKELDIPINGIDIMGGKPYVNKTGLTARILKDTRRVKVIKAIPVLYPMEINVVNRPDDPDFKKYFIGNSTDGTAVFHGIVEFEDGSRFEDEGTASPDSVKMSTMKPHIISLASTRATNRAMRLATAIGMVSIEEINDRGFSISKNNIKNEISTKKIELIFDVQLLFDKLRFNKARQLQYCTKFGRVNELQFVDESKLEVMKMTLEDLKKKSVKKLPAPKKKPIKKELVKKEIEKNVKEKTTPKNKPKKITSGKTKSQKT